MIPVLGGLAAGFVAGLFGIGGGVVLVPLLVLGMGRRQHVAHATSLVGIVLPAAVAATRFAVDGAVAWWPAVAIAAGALAGVQGGAWLAHRIPERGLRIAFTVLLVLTAIRLLLGAAPSGAGQVATTMTVAQALAHVGVGLTSGAASALLGIGGGTVIVPALVILLGYGQHLAEGTSLAVIVPTSLVGAWTHARRGYTDWAVGWRLSTGGVVGGLAGAQVALMLPGSTLARGFGALLVVIAALFIRRSGGRGATGTDEDGFQPDDRVTERAPAVEVRPLAADSVDDWLRFFDREAFPEGHDWEGCYCYFDRFAGTSDDFDAGTAERNRSAMIPLLEAGRVRGWLAYAGDRPVGWLHATSRLELPHLKVDAPLPGRGRRVGVIACFVVASEHRRRGVAGALLDAAVEAFAYQGFHAVEAYPPRDPDDPERAYRGLPSLFSSAGFTVADELDHHLVVRLPLGGRPLGS
ncbi:MAG: GNAT family N-acetyltransferase [Actinobacteria bacterium]|nr:GNAT family N-acetyltransferase [Actinomycetota bacterium]